MNIAKFNQDNFSVKIIDNQSELKSKYTTNNLPNRSELKS